MEEISIRIKTAVEAAEGAKNISELRKSLKDLKGLALETQGTNEKAFKSIANAIGNTTDKLEDLKDEFVAFRGSALEKFNATLQVTKEGFANLDLDKIGTGFKNLGNIIKQNPLLILATAVMGIVDNFKALTEAGGFVGDLFSGIGKAVDYVIKKFFEFTDALGLTDSKAKELAENSKKNAEEMAKAYETSASRAIKANEDWLKAVETKYRREMELAEASGQHVEAIEAKKNEEILKGINREISNLEDEKKIQGKLNEEQKTRLKQLNDLKEEMHHKELVRIAAEETARKNFEQGQLDAVKSNIPKLEQVKRDEQSMLAKLDQEGFDAAQLAKKERLAKIAEEEKVERETQEKELLNAKLAAEQMAIEASINLANTFLNQRKEQARLESEAELTELQEKYNKEDALMAERIAKGELTQEEANKRKAKRDKIQAEQERRLKQEAFNRQKKIDIAQIIMNGAIAAIKTFAQFGGFPAGVAPAAVMAGITAAQVGIAQSQKPAFAKGGLVKGRGTSTSDSIDARLSNGESVINAESTAMFAPLLSAINQAGGGNSFKEPTRVSTAGGVESEGGSGVVRAYVVETDVTQSQNKIKRIQRRATYN